MRELYILMAVIPWQVQYLRNIRPSENPKDMLIVEVEGLKN